MQQKTKQSRLSRREDSHVFTHRLFIALIFAAFALMAWYLAQVIILLFGSIVFAIILRSLALPLHRRTSLPEGWSVATVVLTLVAVLVLIFWLFGAQIGDQFNILADRLPASYSSLVNYITKQPWEQHLIKLQGKDLTAIVAETGSKVAILAGSVMQFVAWAILIFFAGVYLAAQPELYWDWFLRLIPVHRRERVAEIAGLTHQTLKKWLLGQFLTMAVIGTFVAIGLSLLGVNAALALGLIAGLFSFVPYAGAIVAAIPAILMAATQGPLEALYAAMIYGGVHFVEGNLLTPLIQEKIIDLPPVITIFAVVIFGILFGPFGLFFAAPITVICLVALETFYVEDVLGDERKWP